MEEIVEVAGLPDDVVIGLVIGNVQLVGALQNTCA